jgi:hypothetical protein
MKDFTIVHVVGDLSNSSGGIARTVGNITNTISNTSGHIVRIISMTDASQPFFSTEGRNTSHKILFSRFTALRFLALSVRKELASYKKISTKTIFVSHGIWLMSNHWVSEASRLYGIPLIIFPHGMLEPWAIKYKWLKKLIALFLYQRNDLDAAKLFIATSYQEYQSIRKFGLRQPVAVIPNGFII